MTIPRFNPDTDVATAGRAYADAGLYLVPIDARTKHPGSVLGGAWQDQSSRDTQQVTDWFTHTDADGLALHVGRSGLVVFDVDHPDQMPGVLANAIDQCQAPFQSTRPDVSGKGHYVFRQPAGRRIGNSWGQLPKGWGEVRGHNGIIVVAPTEHSVGGGHYEWLRTGHIPELPAELADLLRDVDGDSVDLTDDECRARLAELATGGDPAGEVATILRAALRDIDEHRQSWHETVNAAQLKLLRRGERGEPGVHAALERVRGAFLAAARDDHSRPGNPEIEWRRGLAGAVAGVHRNPAEPVPKAHSLAWPGGGPESAPNKNNSGTEVEDPDGFFSKADGLKVQDLVSAVDDLGPLATDHAGQIYRYTDGAWSPDGERVVNQRIQRLLGNRHRKSHAVNVLDIVQSRDPLFTEDQLDVDHLNLPNGLLDWRVGELQAHDPAVPNLTRLPVAWNPDATCPAVDQWLAEVFPRDAIEFVEEVIGYCLLNDNPMHKAIMLFGTGRNGKGIFVRLLETLVGRGNRSTVRPQQLDDNRFHAAELYGKLANLVGDVDPRIFKTTEIFKQVTGGDTVTAERKYGHPFTFRCRATLVAAFNEMPRTADTSEGFFSRWIVVPFLVYFSDDAADKGLFARLSTPAELEGLLVRAVAGLRRLMARGYFEEPECVQQATAGFRVAADPVRSFLDERAAPVAGTFAHTSLIYGRFKEWCQENGHRPLSLKKFLGRVEAVAAEVLDVPLTRTKRNGHWGYSGLTISDGDGGFGEAPGNLGKEKASSLSLDPAYGGKGGIPSLASPTSPRHEVVSLYCERCGVGGDPNTRLIDGASTCSACAGDT